MKYLTLFVLLVSFSCKNNNPSSSVNNSGKSGENVVNTDTNGLKQETNNVMTEDSVNSDSLSRLVIFFFSNGSGAEYPLINEYIDSIGMFEKNISRKIDYKRIAWGREGETDVIIHSLDMPPSQEEDFIAMTRRVLAKGKFVTIYENYTYNQRRK